MNKGTDAQRIAAIRDGMSSGVGPVRWVSSEDMSFLLSQYDAVVSAHDALAARVGAMEKTLRTAGAIGSADILAQVLPSPGPKGSEAETGAELSGPDPGLAGNRAAAVATKSREARSNPGDGFKPVAALSPVELENIWFYVKQRAAAEDPAVIELLYTRPELRVKITRQVIEADGGTVMGGLAMLISRGFFDSTTSTAAAVKELRRLGYSFNQLGKLQRRR
jgi:hypothetical protein